MRRLLFALALLGASAVGYVAADDDLLYGSGPTAPEPRIVTFAQTDAGCADDVRQFARTQDRPNGTYVFSGTVATRSPNVSLSARAVRTSPPGADVITYRVEMRTHARNASADCPGRVAYRLELVAPDGDGGERVAVFLDGNTVACAGGSYSGYSSGCYLVMAEDRPRTVWANGTAERSVSASTPVERHPAG